jgi:hypothetical protein
VRRLREVFEVCGRDPDGFLRVERVAALGLRFGQGEEVRRPPASPLPQLLGPPVASTPFPPSARPGPRNGGPCPVGPLPSALNPCGWHHASRLEWPACPLPFRQCGVSERLGCEPTPCLEVGTVKICPRDLHLPHPVETQTEVCGSPTGPSQARGAGDKQRCSSLPRTQRRCLLEPSWIPRPIPGDLPFRFRWASPTGSWLCWLRQAS